jgi:NitT/TauT family transport system ATP-binding protein
MQLSERAAHAPATDADAPAIEVTDLHVAYGDLTVLERASLSIGPHEFVSLLGPSGCGKTTLLKVLGGLVEPTGGEVSVFGVSPDDARRQRSIGFVFQEATLLPWRRASSNARLLAEIVGGGAVDDARIAELLQAVGLGGFEDSLPSQLSGGMQQRLAIVRALALNPKLLLMDEPFAALDALTRERLGEILLDIWNAARPIVFVTHSIEEAAFLSDRVIVMSARPGRILADVPVPLPRPRTHGLKETNEFFETTRHLRRLVDEAQASGGAEH